MILLDANVILDVWNADPAWGAWSASQMRGQSLVHELAINAIVYAEISARFSKPAALDEKLRDLGIAVINLPRMAAFLAGKVYLMLSPQRRQQGQCAAGTSLLGHTPWR